MKLHLAQIPDEGLARTLTLELAAMERLSAAVGPQVGTVVAELRIRNRNGSVEINGHLRATLAPPCQRCLDPVAVALDEAVHVALVPDRHYAQAPDDLSLGQGDLEVSFYAGEELDLQFIVEDELLLLLPEPVAEEDDEGQCVVCGRHTDEIIAEAPDAESNHPFARMKALLNND